MKTTIISAFRGGFTWQDIAAYTWAKNAAWAATMGYSFEGHSSSYLDQNLYPPSWDKIRILRDKFHRKESSDEVLIWMDADAVNRKPHLLFMDLEHGKNIGMVEDENGPNAGVIILRMTPDVRMFLCDVWGLLDKYRDHKWWEQAAIHEVLPSYSSIYQKLSSGWNSRFPDTDPIILHAAGIPVHQKLLFLSKNV